jgi:hypothetical protein
MKSLPLIAAAMTFGLAAAACAAITGSQTKGH